MAMIAGLERWISRLEPAERTKTVWADYAQAHSYSEEETNEKKRFVEDFARTVKPTFLWDLGCNTGEFSKASLKAGAASVIGFDFDQNSLDRGFIRGRSEELNFLPLFLDAANPSPNQGWASQERRGLLERSNADALLALAFIHHLAITRNIPLGRLVNWLVDIAPEGVIEFVPKEDPMVKELLRLREDVFEDYNVETFLSHLSKRAQIVRKTRVSKSGRLLVWYSRLTPSACDA